MTRYKDLAGRRFGRLIAVSIVRRMAGSRERTFWACTCDCGRAKEVRSELLLRGDALSCGCFQRERISARSKTHGQSGTRLYRTWRGMLTRCRNRRCSEYANYGGRGIDVSAEWAASFEAFAAYMGEHPGDGASIDRIDNDGDYEPGNVRWSTAAKQGRNRRGLTIIDVDGQPMCLAEAAERAGLPYATIYGRVVTLGWPVADALSVPSRVGQKHLAHIGAKPRSRFPGSRQSALKKKINGSVEYRR